MALNSASHNTPGIKTGPISGQPPPVSEEAQEQILQASETNGIGQSAPGRDGGDKDAGKKVKSEKELAKERAKQEKLRKFQEKQAKQASKADNKPKDKPKPKPAATPQPDLSDYVEETPKGQKKILKPLDDEWHKAYVPKVVESAWADWWDSAGFFKPDFANDGGVKPAGRFVIPIPPPNVTGALHCGHALGTALQDVLIRWHRMRGFTTLYLPGCDHAGISTQSVVENMLWRREHKTRHDLGRAALVERIWAWKGEYHEKIRTVLKRMGGSFDWTREAFTMDSNLSAAVIETFCQLHDEGLIYRSNRLVNWCPRLRTALSNLEVDNKEISGRTLLDVPGYDRKVEFGVLTYFNYPIKDSNEVITVATTRPETMLGDTGIAVHPNDARYKHLVGKTAAHPIVDREIPVFSDEYVDPEFGTGAVKITPAHDFNDFNLGKRHDLPFINIMNDDGSLNDNAGKYAGKGRWEARYQVTAELESLGLFVRKEDNAMKIPLCSRTRDVVEPLIKMQWWMNMESMAQAGLKAVKDGAIKIRPDTAERSYFRWLEGIQDWCLSRQVWWGHQTPAYRVIFPGKPEGETDESLWITARTPEEAQAKAEKEFEGQTFTLKRDEDVLDTWFSSGLWPFSTLGWPNEKSHDFQTLFPTSCLETGWDILFFWVARMIMLSLKMTGKVPFTEVYCHGLVRDSEGRKMSKSLGNVIDPIDIMEGISLKALNNKLLQGNLDPKELKTATKYQQTAFPQTGIPECGADALRFALVSYTTTNNSDIAFDVRVIHAYRRFANKIYQATKYVLGKIGEDFRPRSNGEKTGFESLSEKWILHKMNEATRNINNAVEQREFSKSTQIVYDLWYDRFCDVFIENTKAILQDGNDVEKRSALDTLYTVLDASLRILHPFMPFLSEELWQRLPRRPGDQTSSITITAYPEYNDKLEDPEAEAAYEVVLGASKAVRSLMSEYKIESGKLFVQATDKATYEIVINQVQAIRSLSGKGVASISVLSPTEPSPTGCAVDVVSSTLSVFLEVRGRVNVDEEITKAQAKMKKASEAVTKQRKVLDAEDFQSKVSDAVQDEERKKLREALAAQENYERSIQQFETLKLEA